MGTHPIFESDFDCLTVVKSQLRANNPHHLIVEEKAALITREVSGLLRETVQLGKSTDQLKHAHRAFAQCDKVFVHTESKLASISRSLKVIEKCDAQIINSLSCVPTIQANLAAAKSHFKASSTSSSMNNEPSLR